MDGLALPCVCQLPVDVRVHSSIPEVAQSEKTTCVGAGSSALTFILQVQLSLFSAVLMQMWTGMCSQILSVSLILMCP